MAGKRRAGKKKSTPQGKAALAAAYDAALGLAAVQGWRETSLSDIAEEAGIELADLRRLVHGKAGLLTAFTREIDAQMVSEIEPELMAEPVRDRIFDIMMRRFDALAPYKAGIKAIARDMSRDPFGALCQSGPGLQRTARWLLDAARVDSWGPCQPLQENGLIVIYLATLRVWLKDEDTDMSATMAALDKGLTRADGILGMLRGRSRRPDDDDDDDRDGNRDDPPDH